MANWEEVLDSAVSTLGDAGVSPPYLVYLTEENARDLTENYFETEYAPDENGEQRIGQYIIITRKEAQPCSISIQQKNG